MGIDHDLVTAKVNLDSVVTVTFMALNNINEKMEKKMIIYWKELTGVGKLMEK